MLTWHDLAEKQKAVLSLSKDKISYPLVKRIPLFITPNSLSYTRMLMASALLLYFIFPINSILSWLFTGYLLAKLTDMLDGSLARIRHTESLYGEFLDIMADKIFYLVGFLILLRIWPRMISFYFIFLVISISLAMIIINYSIIRRQSAFAKNLKLVRRVLEGTGYVLALIILAVQIIIEIN